MQEKLRFRREPNLSRLEQRNFARKIHKRLTEWLRTEGKPRQTYTPTGRQYVFRSPDLPVKPDKGMSYVWAESIATRPYYNPESFRSRIDLWSETTGLKPKTEKKYTVGRRKIKDSEGKPLKKLSDFEKLEGLLEAL